MNKKLLSILQYLLFMGLGIFLIWWQLRTMTPAEKAEFTTALQSANYWLMIPVVFMSLFSHLSRAMRWQLLLHPMGYRPQLKNTFATTMVGYLANSAIPRLGEVLKCTLLARYERLPFEKVLGTIIIERAFDLICYILFIAITVLVQLDLLDAYVRNKLSIIFNKDMGIPGWLLLLLLMLTFILVAVLLRRMIKSNSQNKWVARLQGFVKGIIQGFSSIKNLQKKNQFLAHTFFIWAMYLLQVYLGFFAMDGLQGLDIRAACSVLALATLAMIATPGGIGSFPIFVMETLLIYHIASPTGKAFGWLIWGTNTAIIVLAGLISLLLLPYINKNKDNEPAASIH